VRAWRLSGVPIRTVAMLSKMLVALALTLALLIILKKKDDPHGLFSVQGTVCDN
jgi:hypothetical protein